MPTELDRTLTALADPARRAVVDLLQSEPRCSSALADALSLSRPAMSRHLSVLRRAGVVEETGLGRDARVRVYRLRHQSFDALRAWLENVNLLDRLARRVQSTPAGFETPAPACD